MRIPQWKVSDISVSTRNLEASTRKQGASSSLVLSIHAERQSLFMLRLVVLPLTLIVMLSWSVFWMERSSLGDRMSISFIGILTAVAYQIVVSNDILPQISYVTLMHAFLNISFCVMCATVVINLTVGACDKKGNFALGDRIDRCCRWAFPIVYVTLVSVAAAIAFLCF